MYPVERSNKLTDQLVRVDRVFAAETADSGSISGRVKPKTIKIGIHSFPD